MSYRVEVRETACKVPVTGFVERDTIAEIDGEKQIVTRTFEEIPGYEDGVQYEARVYGPGLVLGESVDLDGDIVPAYVEGEVLIALAVLDSPVRAQEKGDAIAQAHAAEVARVAAEQANG